MNDIAKNGLLGYMPNFIENALEATRNMTAPQATVAVAGIGSATTVACYTIHKISGLIKGGCIKRAGFKHVTVDFDQPKRAGNA